jgi:hypothetical protein
MRNVPGLSILASLTVRITQDVLRLEITLADVDGHPVGGPAGTVLRDIPFRYPAP